MTAKQTILVIGAHSDDPAFGAGGTIAKYALEGHKVKSIIFSYGELSHPHLKPEIVAQTRAKEAKISDKILGGKGVTFFDLKEGRFSQDIKTLKTEKELIKIIQKEKPIKIFTHGANDAHPDHLAVYNLIKEMINKKEITCEVYSFDVWSIVRLRKRAVPRLVVDITSTFNKKLKSIEAHKSQTMTMLSLGWTVYFKAIMNGWNNNCKYAEVFDKIE